MTLIDTAAEPVPSGTELEQHLLSALTTLREGFAEQAPVDDGVTALLRCVSTGATGDLSDLVDATQAQALLSVEPLSEFLGQMFPGVTALYFRAVDPLINVERVPFAQALNDLSATVAPFTPDAATPVHMLAGIVAIAMEVAAFDSADLAAHADWLDSTVGPLPEPVQMTSDDEDVVFPDEAAEFLAICRDADLSISQGLVILARVVDAVRSYS